MEKTLKTQLGPNPALKKSTSLHENLPLKHVPQAIAPMHPPLPRPHLMLVPHSATPSLTIHPAPVSHKKHIPPLLVTNLPTNDKIQLKFGSFGLGLCLDGEGGWD